MEDVFRFADDLGPFKIVHIHRPAIALKAVVAIDNVACGPSLGGVRMAPDVSAEEMTPVVRELLEELGRGERRLITLEAARAGPDTGLRSRWVKAGRPLAASPAAVDALGAELVNARDRGTPAVEELLRSIARIRQTADEIEHPNATLVVRRIGRRSLRLTRRATARIRGRDTKPAQP